MKYSQAVLVACIGGAALASAIPTSIRPDSTLTSRELTDGENPSTNTPSPAAPVAQGPNHHGHGGGHKESKEAVEDNGGADKPKKTKKKKHGSHHKSSNTPSSSPSSMTTRDLEDELSARLFDSLKANYYNRKAEGLQKQAAKATAISGTYRREFLDELDARDFDEELSMRDVDDELSARLFDSLKANYYNRKGESLQKQAAKATAIAGTYRREFVDELDARDFDEELSMRDVDDELSARLFDTLKANYYNRKGESLQKQAAKATAIAGSYRRELVDELEARGKILNALGALKDTVLGKRPGAGSVATDPNAVVARNFIEDLDARDFEFGIDELD